MDACVIQVFAKKVILLFVRGGRPEPRGIAPSAFAGTGGAGDRHRRGRRADPRFLSLLVAACHAAGHAAGRDCRHPGSRLAGTFVVLAIHIVFMPLVVGVRALDLPAWTWPTGLILLLLVFWRTDRGQVPSALNRAGSILPNVTR